MNNKRKLYLKEWHKNHPNYNKLYSRKWRKNNYEKNLEYQRIYQSKWRQENRQKTREAVKKSYYKHKEKRLNYTKKWYRRNKKRVNKERVKMAMRDYYSNPKSWLVMNLRGRLIRVLNRGTKKLKKTAHTYKLLGADISTIKIYLENQFKPGMNWDNRGKWHIDHIIPLINFDLSKKVEQEKAFHYTNLQPLWAIENLRKGKRLL